MDKFWTGEGHSVRQSNVDADEDGAYLTRAPVSTTTAAGPCRASFIITCFFGCAFANGKHLLHLLAPTAVEFLSISSVKTWHGTVEILCARGKCCGFLVFNFQLTSLPVTVRHARENGRYAWKLTKIRLSFL